MLVIPAEHAVREPGPILPVLIGPGSRDAVHRLAGMTDEETMDSLATENDILKAAEDWKAAGRGVALATVVETWGSAPRPVGSNLVIDDQGNFLGSVSGGCVEGAVVTEALDVIESGKPKTLEFGVADETAWKVGLSCGGTIRVFVEKVD
jgi:XdhC and CoxI family